MANVTSHFAPTIEGGFGARANQLFDRLVGIQVGFLGRKESAFLACGKVGLVLAIALGVWLTSHQGLSLIVILTLSGTSVLALLGQSLVMKVLTGTEQLVYYRHEIAIVTVAAITLLVLDQPIWPYLDITILAVGTFLVCGRVGCLMVGCCHGRPHAWGPKYSAAHVAAGFTRHYAGIRLFPIQILESLWVLVIVVVGVTMVLGGSRPGEAFAWYVIAYDIGRFGFEFARGDPDRPYIGGFSEAQWTSVLLMVAILIAEVYDVLPFHAWHWVATGGVVAAGIAVVWSRRVSALPRHRLLHPQHVREIATALEAAEQQADSAAREGAIVLVRTSLGVQLSTDIAAGPSGSVRHYAISWSQGEISADTARTLAELILTLKQVTTNTELTRGPMGVFHLLVGPLDTR
jgi:hypothetical protein